MTTTNKIAIFITSAVMTIILVTPCVSDDWVHPALRQTYAGYEKLKNRKKNSPDWTYATNRPQGNIHGGGTSAYKDYTLSYTPPRKKDTTYSYPSPKKKSPSSGCNCGN